MSEQTDRQSMHILSQARDELLALLVQEEELADQAQAPAIGIGRDGGPAPLSFAQQRLWFFEQSEPGSPVYNVPCAFRMRGPLHVEILRKSIQRIIQRHASLRTTFIMVDGVPQQHIAQELTLQIPEEDLRHLAGEQQQGVMLQRASQEAREGFDVERGPLLRGLLFLLAPDHHILLLTFHHSIFDGWSRELFLQELCAFYEAYLAGTGPQLVELPLQYADFARWQRQHLDEEQTRTRLQAYWRQQLDELPVLEFPTDQPRPARQTYDGATFSFTVPQALYRALQVLSRRENVTLFMTVLGAFQVLLARYTAQDDIVIGTPIANRNRAELEHLIGFFVNMLVIRTRIEINADFLTLLRRVRETVLDAYAHQDFPFERLVEMLRPERDASRSPLFQVVCILQNLPSTQRSCSNLTITPVKVPLGVSKFDLTLELVEAKGELSGFIEYNTALFNVQIIRRLAGHWLRLLEGIVQDPQRPLHSLPVLTADERQQILYDWNAPDREPLPPQPFHELFSEQVERTPDAVAISCEQGVVTYQALERYANQLARYLRAHGVTAESPVGVYLERTPAAIISILGIFKAGGCYVPLDPATPRDRLEYMLQTAGIQVLLTLRKLLTTLPVLVTHSIALDARWSDITHESWCSLDNRVELHHLAYIIFTSGTTGRPKGVLIEHRGLVNLACVQKRIFDVGPASRVLQFAPLSFDASIWEICLALLSGATLILPPVDLPLIGQALWQTLSSNAISAVTLPPSILAHLPEEPLPDLQTLIVAGEACPATLAERWGNGRRFFNAYGPTEATVCATIGEYQPGGPITIGRPISHTQIYLLDPYLQPVPVGIPGEIYIAGVGIARGYIGGANERFLPHPFVGTLLAERLSTPTMNRGATGRFRSEGLSEASCESSVDPRNFKERFTASEPGARLYRTGDLARYTTDGSIEYLGRVDQQVKIRGFRVEPGEVESLLLQHPAISQCLVCAHVCAPGDAVLLAYIVLRSESAQQATNLDSELRAYLQEKVPGYMLPSDFVYLSRLPLNTHGKVDHRALPVPALRERERASAAAYVAPQTPLEQLIAGCWQEVLHLNQVSLHDNFFDLGGHSLLAVRIQQRLQQALQRPINLIDLFTYTTVSALAQALNIPSGASCPPHPAQSKRTEQAAQISEQRRLRTRSRTVKE